MKSRLEFHVDKKRHDFASRVFRRHLQALGLLVVLVTWAV